MRWWILGLLFLATLINYMDRTIFAVLVPVMRGDLHIDNEVYGKLTAAFLFAYTVGYLIMGRVVDRLGTKAGFAVAAGVWSIAAGLHATASSALQLGGFRAMLGFAEAGNFPAAIKAVAEWFPAEQRALRREFSTRARIWRRWWDLRCSCCWSISSDGGRASC